MDQLLERVQTGSFATLNADGTPYITPMHFLHMGCQRVKSLTILPMTHE
ncbi:pyridoxamine 5'-phosphate oxidase family protein [Clostridium liquoris]|nr:pyridoxamine 5'-phosphate oxidase family protein [Clostridium liquoris]